MITTLLAAAAVACPVLAGDYFCVTSFSPTPQAWSLTQTVNAKGYDVYFFDRKTYVSDGVSRLDPSLSYDLAVTATCAAAAPTGTSTQLVIDEVGDLDDRGTHVHFTNQNVLEMNAKDQLVSRYSHDGRLIDTMTCARR